MTIKITKEKYEEIANFMREMERRTLRGCKTQTIFNTQAHEVYGTLFQTRAVEKFYIALVEQYLASLPEDERKRAMDKSNTIQIYATKPGTNKLRDLYKDKYLNVDWDDENYKLTNEYEALEKWYLNDPTNGFKVYEILDEVLKQNKIEVAS